MRLAPVALLLPIWLGAAAAFAEPAVQAEPAGVLSRLGSDALRHPGPIHALAFSPDGKLLACAGEGSIGLFDAETGEPRGQFAAHEGNVVALAFAPSGEQLASAGVDGTARLWNLRSPTAAGPAWSYRWMESVSSYRAQRACLRFTPDGKQVVVTDALRASWALDAATGRLLQLSDEPAGQLASLSADGRWLFVACAGGRVRVVETATGKRRPEVTLTIAGLRFSVADPGPASSRLRQFHVAPDGNRLLLGTERTLVAVDLTSKELLGTIALREGWYDPQSPVRVAFSPNGEQVAVLWSKAGRPTVEVHAWPGGDEIRRFVLNDPGADVLVFSPDGRRLAAADGIRVRLWSVADGKELCDRPGHDGPVTSVLFSLDGARVATAAADRSVRLWDAVGGKPLGRFPAAYSFESQSPMAFSPNGRLLAIDQWFAIVLVESRDGKLSRQIATPLREGRSPWFAPCPRVVAFSPDSARLITWSEAEGVLRQWDVATGKGLGEQRIDVPERGTKGELAGTILLGLPPAVMLSPDGELLAATRVVGDELVVWETRTGRRSFDLKSQTPITSSLFSPDGRLLAVGRTSGLMQLWDPRDGGLRQSFEGPRSGSFPRAFLDGGQTLVSDHGDNTTRFWDVATGVEVFRIEGCRLRACSPDGRYAASVAPRQVVLVWEMAKLKKGKP